jgi:hypothetical protein
VVEIIKSFKNLEDLNLEKTRVTDQIVYELIKHNRSLKSLNLAEYVIQIYEYMNNA